MAQTVFVNMIVDVAAASKADQTTHGHNASLSSTAAANDLTVSFDPTKVKSKNALRSLLDQVFKTVSSTNILT
jgi:2C-methyl-D-erythritol 2,4-cyclodiphosphate synthase